MCDFSSKLIAFLDRELPDAEMTLVERHLESCLACRKELAACSQVSQTFDAFCDQLALTRTPRRIRLWAILSGAAAVPVAAAILFSLFTPTTQPPPSFHPASSLAPPPLSLASVAIVPESANRPVPAIPKHHSASKRQPQSPTWIPAEPPIQIAFPADSMFPPGAFPQGVNFTADLSIATDGSPQQISLQPKLIEFRRRLTQP